MDLPILKDGIDTQQAPKSSPSAPEMADETIATLKTAYRKTDIRLVIWYSFVYLVLKVESHNITNAAIMNIEAGTDIQHQLGNLTSEQWALILSVYHYSHILFEPLSALPLKKLTPRKWMSRIMLSWGIVAMCSGATQNFAGLLACRFLLGLTEAGYVPGVLYHLSFWYPAERLPLRLALFYGLSQLSGTMSGLLAFAISFLNGIGGLAGWRWLFILEGVPAILCGIFTFFHLPNYPQEAQFLDEPEKTSVLASLPKTQPNSGDKTWDWQQAKDLFTDVTTYSFLAIWMCHATGARAVNTVLPTIIYQLDISSSARAQLMTMPPYLIGAAGLIAIAWFIRTKKLKSWPCAMCLEGLGCVCYIVLIVVESPYVKYGLIILAVTSSFAVIPLLWPERIRATRGTTSAGLAIGLTGAASGLQGIVGPQIYQNRFGPSYRVSFSVSTGLACATIISIIVTWAVIRKRDRFPNAQKSAGIEGPYSGDCETQCSSIKPEQGREG